MARCCVVRVPIAFDCIKAILVNPTDILANEILKLPFAVEKLLLWTNLELLVVKYFMIRVT